MNPSSSSLIETLPTTPRHPPKSDDPTPSLASSTVSISISSSTATSSSSSFSLSSSTSSLSSTSSNWLVESLSNSAVLTPTVPDLTFSFGLPSSTTAAVEAVEVANDQLPTPSRKDTDSTTATTPTAKTFLHSKITPEYARHYRPAQEKSDDDTPCKKSSAQQDLAQISRDGSPNPILNINPPALVTITNPQSDPLILKNPHVTPTKNHEDDHIVNRSTPAIRQPSSQILISPSPKPSKSNHHSNHNILKSKKSLGFSLSNHSHRIRNPSLESQLDVITQSNKLHSQSTQITTTHPTNHHQPDQSTKASKKKSLLSHNPASFHQAGQSSNSRRFSSYLPFFNSSGPGKEDGEEVKSPLRRTLNRRSFNILNRPITSSPLFSSQQPNEVQALAPSRQDHHTHNSKPRHAGSSSTSSSDLPIPYGNHLLEPSSSASSLSNPPRHQPNPVYPFKASRSLLNLLSSKFK